MPQDKPAPTFSALLGYNPERDALKGRILLITGAAHGIGRALAIASASFGATTVLLDNDGSGLGITEEEIVSQGFPAPVLCMLDLAGGTLDDLRTVAGQIETEFGRLDGLVNNAGWIGALSPFEHCDAATWSRALNINLAAPFFLTQQCMRVLHRADDPVVVFSLDNASRAYWGGYGVAKAGLEGLLHILADEYHPESAHPVRIIGVDPGPVMTPGRSRHYPGEQADAHPHPEAVMGPYLYALGSDAKGATGLVLR